MRPSVSGQCDKSLPGSLPLRALEGNSENVLQLSHSSRNESTIHGPCLIYNFLCLLDMISSRCLQKVFRGKSVISEKRSGYPFTIVNVCFIRPDRAMTTITGDPILNPLSSMESNHHAFSARLQRQHYI